MRGLFCIAGSARYCGAPRLRRCRKNNMADKELNRVLYVEDEPDIREVARFALEYSGDYEVKICESGAEALSIVGTFKPDIILLDVMMPGMDGLATMEALRQREETVDVPIVFMTAKVQSAEVSRYLALGAASVIPKPFDPRTLGATVKEIWEEHTG
jgi:two-component system, OmpR family, response regulator